MAHRLRPLAAAALAAAALAALLPPSSASAAWPPRGVMLDVHIDVRFTTTYDTVREAYPDPCQDWTVSNGRQAIEIKARRPQRLLIEKVLGMPVMSTVEGLPRATFDADISRSYEAEGNLRQESECSPCGPLSEYGECPASERPDPVYTFDCRPKGRFEAEAGLGHATGHADLRKGVLVQSYVEPVERFFGKRCPGPSGELSRPPELVFPQAFLKEVLALRPGKVAVTRIRDELGMAAPSPYDPELDGTVRRRSCDAVPEVRDGTTFCTLTTYFVEIKRVR
jgi:hypothetical protein